MRDPNEMLDKLLALVLGKCPACKGEDLHSAVIDGHEGVSCCECPWGVSYTQLVADVEQAKI